MLLFVVVAIYPSLQLTNDEDMFAIFEENLNISAADFKLSKEKNGTFLYRLYRNRSERREK